jgi:short-subunit dehydrogenase
VALSDGKPGLALITGASSGLGAEFARELAARHHPLLLVARRRDRLEQLARQLRTDVAIVDADLTAPGAIDRVVAATEAHGPLEILVNNAGYATWGPFLTLDPAREQDMIELNTVVPLLLSRALLPSLIARGSGGIINVSSIAAFQAVAYMATYGATKAFVLNLSEAMHEELRDTGVRVFCVCPGPTATEFFAVARTPRSMGKMPHMMRADEVVSRALDAFFDGRTTLVPGAINFLTAVAAHLAPRPLVRKVTRLLFQPR